MLLYHGTSMEALKQILLDQALRPRAKTGSKNWSHTINSHPQCVYLTNVYGGYFGLNAIPDQEISNNGGSKMVIIEVDSDALSELIPDEDAVEQSTRPQGKMSKSEMLRRTKGFKVRLHRFRGSQAWQQSIAYMGTCAHWGEIDLWSAVTRIAIVQVDHEETKWKCYEAMDPSITATNYMYCREKYEELTKWFFEPGAGKFIGTPMEVLTHLALETVA